MFNKSEMDDLKEIQKKLSKHLNRDIGKDLITKTILEFMELHEKQLERYEKAIKEAIGECLLEKPYKAKEILEEVLNE